MVKALPKMVKNATAPELVNALKNHLEETKEQVSSLVGIFAVFGLKAQAKKM